MQLLPIAFAVVLSLTACGGSSSDDGVDGADAGSTSDRPVVDLVDTGFGQSDVYVQGIAVVSTADENAVGEYVTVSMNFLDESGEILKTEEQVESLSWVGQELVLPVWLDLSDNPKAKVASVDASVSLSDHGTAAPNLAPLATLEAESVKEGKYGGVTATFEMTNDSDTDLEDLRVGVVCYDASGQVIGGSSHYPSLIAAGKSIRLDVDVTTTGTPASCKAFPNYGA